MWQEERGEGGFGMDVLHDTVQLQSLVVPGVYLIPSGTTSLIHQLYRGYFDFLVVQPSTLYHELEEKKTSQ